MAIFMKKARFQRQTRQRRVILEELQKSHEHPTASELYEMVRKRLPKISLGTVYRNLEMLAHRGLIRKLDLSGTGARFDGDLSRHYHVRCVGCGKLDDVEVGPDGLNEIAFSPPAGYQILGYRIELTGVCQDCRLSGHAGKTSPPRRDRGKNQRGSQAEDL